MAPTPSSRTGGGPPTLSDGHVTLRAMRRDDVPRMVEQCLDPESVRWTTVPVPFSAADAETFLAVCEAGWADDSQWAFAVEHAGLFGGSVTLRSQGHGRADIGVGSHPAVRGLVAEGRSVMERAVRLLLAWGFAARGLRVVRWDTYVGNWASRRLAWKVGFRFEGTTRQLLVQRGELRDAWVGTLLAGEPPEPATPWLTAPVLRGERVVLRLPVAADIPRAVEAARDAGVVRWLPGIPQPYGEEHARAWVADGNGIGARGDRLHWAIADADTDAYLGGIDLHDIRPGRHAEIGYLTHPGARGRGVVTEATRLAARYAFESLGLRVLRAGAGVENTGSRRALERAGFRFVGVDRLGVREGSGLADAARYDLLPGDL